MTDERRIDRLPRRGLRQRRRRRQAGLREQPPGDRRRHPARPDHGRHRGVRLREILPGVRRRFPGSPAPLHGIVLLLCPPVSWASSDGPRSPISPAFPRPSPSASGRSTGNPRSTVGTLTELYDLLRLLYARLGDAPGRDPAERSLFSFNSPRGACPACKGLGVEDRIDPELLVADPVEKPSRGALVITTPSGYVIYSQVTMDVLDRVCRAHGFSVDIPWKDLTEEQRDVVLNGSDRILDPLRQTPPRLAHEMEGHHRPAPGRGPSTRASCPSWRPSSGRRGTGTSSASPGRCPAGPATDAGSRPEALSGRLSRPGHRRDEPPFRYEEIDGFFRALEFTGRESDGRPFHPRRRPEADGPSPAARTRLSDARPRVHDPFAAAKPSASVWRPRPGAGSRASSTSSTSPRSASTPMRRPGSSRS